MTKLSRGLACATLLGALPGLAAAADLDGSQLSVLWGVPFAGILLSIALLPLLAPIFWHHHFGKVAAAWGLAFLVPFAITFGPGVAGVSLVHALVAEYIPFVILLTALFTVAGGIFIRGNLHGSPGLNTAILAVGSVLASFMGTTGDFQKPLTSTRATTTPSRAKLTLPSKPMARLSGVGSGCSTSSRRR